MKQISSSIIPQPACGLFTLLMVAASLFSQPELPAKRAIALYAPVPPVIDGLVDEIWLQAPVNSDFLQREPRQEEPATQNTRFYVLYDNHNLYFLFVMLDDDPAIIPSRLLERDQRFSPDDNINFFLDTYRDHRKAFFFSTNPAGVEQDGLISENGDRLDMTWDTIYKVAARKNNFGWVAEFAIPFNSIRFTDDLQYQIWGFNVWRVQKKNRETSYWSLVEQDFHPLRLDKAGVLIGMRNIHSGQHVRLLPYLTARNITDPDSSENDAQVGIDVKYGVTSDLTLDLTLNPDFGQVEIDEEQINLDKRYEIQLEEKRPFFLENTNLFQTPFYQLFYSRRIGLDSQIKAGAKLTGKVEHFSLGMLGAYSGGWENYGLGDPDTPPTDELFSLVRAQRDILSNSNLGIIYIDRAANLGSSSNREREYNRAAGVDFNAHSGQFYLVGQGVYSYNADVQQTLTGSGIFTQTGYYGRLFRLDVHGLHYTPDFDLNKVGYFQKIENKGSTQAGLYTDIHPRVNRRFLRSWGISFEPIFMKNSDEQTAGGGLKSRAWIELPDQSDFEIGYTRYRDTEADNFYHYFGRSRQKELIYWGRDFYAEVNTDRSKPVFLRLVGNVDSQYYFQTHSTGYSRGFEVHMQVRPRSNAFFEVEYHRRQFLNDDLNLMPEEKIGQPDVVIWNFSGRYLFSREIFTRIFFQYTNGAEDYATDSLRVYLFPLQYETWERMSGNFLLGWRFHPGSTLYLAYTGEWNNQFSRVFQSSNRILFFKFSYLWRL